MIFSASYQLTHVNTTSTVPTSPSHPQLRAVTLRVGSAKGPMADCSASSSTKPLAVARAMTTRGEEQQTCWEVVGNVTVTNKKWAKKKKKGGKQLYDLEAGNCSEIFG